MRPNRVPRRSTVQCRHAYKHAATVQFPASSEGSDACILFDSGSKSFAVPQGPRSGTGIHNRRATMNPLSRGKKGAPPRGPSSSTGFVLENCSCNHQSSADRILPSVMESTTIEGIP